MPLVTITWADVVARYPLLATFDPTAGAAIVEEVQIEIVNPDWGADANRAAKALAAHLADSSRRAGAGPVTSETAGPLSRSYAAPALLTALGSTPYGQEFERIRSSIPAFRFLQPFCSFVV